MEESPKRKSSWDDVHYMDGFKYVFSKHKSLKPKIAIFSSTKEHISTMVYMYVP
jgi:hypothetical protein